MNTLSISEILSATVVEIRENVRLVALYIGIAVLVEVGYSFVEREVGSSSMFGLGFGLFFGEDLLSGGLLGVAIAISYFVVIVLLSYWLCAGMVRRAVAPDFDKIAPFIGIYILSSIGIGFGFLLLIVPGIILSIRWLIVLPLLLGANIPAMDTFGESFMETRTSAWSIFAVALIIFVVAIALIYSSELFGLTLGGPLAIPATLLTALVETVLGVVFLAFSVGVFRLLTGDTKGLTEVFE
ncbi:MAG: hypothetical protein AAF127_00365 [Pseudomonadota bacterium]